MAADPGLWLHIYPYGTPLTGKVEYTGNNASYYDDKYYEFSSENMTSGSFSQGYFAVFGGEFGTGEDIRITITVNGVDYIYNEKSVYGSSIKIYLNDLPMDVIGRPQETIFFWATDGSQPISIKSLLTNKEYTAVYDDGGFWYANLDLCDTILVTAPGYKPLVQLVDPCINNDVGQWYVMERYADDGSIPNKLYGYENLSVTPVGKRWYGWTTVDDSPMYWTIYTETPEGAKAGGVKMYALDNSTGRMLYYDTSDSDSSPRAVGGQRYTRNPAYDIVIYEKAAQPIFYTTIPTLSAGDKLYTSYGADTGYLVGNVLDVGQFEIDLNQWTLTINCTSSLGIYANNFVVTEVETGAILYIADSLAPPATVTIDFPKTSTLKITNLMSGAVYSSGSGCWGLSVTNCSETHDSISSNGNSYSGYYNNVVLSNFTGDPTINLDFGYGK